MEDAPFPICERHVVDIIRHYMLMTRGMARDEYDESLGFEPMKREERYSPPEFVYFIRYRDRVKIGTTTNVIKRLASLPYDEVLAVVNGGRDVEREWHDKYHQHRDQGEWFIPYPKMLDEIKALGTCA